MKYYIQRMFYLHIFIPQHFNLYYLKILLINRYKSLPTIIAKVHNKIRKALNAMSGKDIKTYIKLIWHSVKIQKNMFDINLL